MIRFVALFFLVISASVFPHEGPSEVDPNAAPPGAPDVAPFNIDNLVCRSGDGKDTPPPKRGDPAARKPYPIPPRMEVEYLDEKDYERKRLLMLYTVSKIEEILKKKPDAADAKEIQKVLNHVKPRIQDATLPMAALSDNRHNAAILSLTGPKGVKTVLTFNKDFNDMYFNDPLLTQGILLHEMQHMVDIETLGFGKDEVRISGTHESRGHEAQAKFYTLAKAAGLKSDAPRFERSIAALAKGTGSPEWKGFVSDQQGIDYKVSDRFQAFRFQDLPGMKDADAGTPYKDLLIPAAQAAGDDMKKLEGMLEKLGDIKMGSPEQLELRRTYARVKTYLSGAITLNNAIMDQVRRPPAAAIALNNKWGKLHNDLSERHKALLRNKTFVEKVGDPPDPKLTEDGKRHQKDFEKWIEDNKDSVGMGDLFRRLCA